jgi:HK97 family phage prohead protease
MAFLAHRTAPHGAVRVRGGVCAPIDVGEMSDQTITPPSLPAVEHRFAELDEYEIRAGDVPDSIVFEGHAAVFDSPSEPMGGFVETIARGAFRKAIPDSDVRFLWNHQSDAPLARSSVKSGPGSLHLSEDHRGLLVDAEFVNTTLARDLRELVHTGVVREMSFAWPRGAAQDSWVQGDEQLQRTIHSFSSLRDVSLVSFPAYPEANDAVMRSLVCGIRIMEGDTVLEDELRAIADKIVRGERMASAEDRLIIDEAFARIDSLSPWMEERARRAFGIAAESVASRDAEEGGDLHTVGDRQSVAARERQYRLRQRLLGVRER